MSLAAVSNGQRRKVWNYYVTFSIELQATFAGGGSFPVYKKVVSAVKRTVPILTMEDIAGLAQSLSMNFVPKDANGAVLLGQGAPPIFIDSFIEMKSEWATKEELEAMGLRDVPETPRDTVN